MRKMSYYIAAVVIVGLGLVSFWVYLRYFRTKELPFLYFTVSRGDIQESIKVRSEVVSQKEFELEFPFGGTVETIFAKEGNNVSLGQPLAKLETRDFEIEASQLRAIVEQRKADLAKLRAGVTSEEVKVSEARLSSAQVGLNEAKKNLVEAIKDAYTKSDDAVRAKTDQFFDNPRSANPVLNITADGQAKVNLNFSRLTLEGALNSWSASLATISSISDLSTYLKIAKQNTASISDYLNILSPVVNNLMANPSLLQATIDGYKASVSLARTNVNAAITELGVADEKLKLAEAEVALADSELALKQARARTEDIIIAEARVKESESGLATVSEKIRKSTLLSPVAGKISKVYYEVGEVFRPGKSIVSLEAAGYKLQTDVSELDISKVHESDTNNVSIEFDAFPGRLFDGRVVSVDSKEVVKTEDKYYRVNIIFDAKDIQVRPGMSADTKILSSKQKNVLRVSELAIYTENKNKYAKVLLPGLTTAISENSFKKVDVKTGITDGDAVEILSGLQEGQILVVSAE